MINLKQKLASIKLNTWHLVLTAVYFASYSILNIISIKTYGNANLAITAAGTFSLSWIIFLCMDIFTEIWGKKSAMYTFVGAAVLNTIMVGLFWLCIVIPGTDPFINEVFAVVFGTTWRILLASLVAFLIGNYFNTAVLDKMRKKTRDENHKGLFMIRAIVSSIVGQIIDNSLFFIIAFSPIGILSTVELPWIAILQMILLTTAIEIALETVISPITANIVMYFKKKKELEMEE